MGWEWICAGQVDLLQTHSVYWYKSTRFTCTFASSAPDAPPEARVIKSTCFTGTKVLALLVPLRVEPLTGRHNSLRARAIRTSFPSLEPLMCPGARSAAGEASVFVLFVLVKQAN
jgi:hypothetical protein